jgi:hypothetical protein
VIAYLQSLGGTPTVTLQTSHRYYAAPPAPGGAPPAGAPPDENAEPGEALPLAAPPAEKAAPPAPSALPGVAPAPGGAVTP